MQCAWAATKTKDTYLSVKYKSLLRKGLGSKKALISIAHKMLKSIYYIIKDKIEYKDLGPNYLRSNCDVDKLVKNFVKSIEKFGKYKVQLVKVEEK